MSRTHPRRQAPTLRRNDPDESISAEDYRKLANLKAKPSKYRAKRTEVDGQMFASKAEANRYIELQRLQKAGIIEGLVTQYRYPLHVNGIKVCDYVADFVYWDNERQEKITEDVKGMRTPVYNLKKRMMKAQYDITIQEITS